MSDNNLTPSIDAVRDFLAANQGKNVLPPANMWPDANIDEENKQYTGDLTAGLEGIMFDYARQMSAHARFPVSSTFLTMMGAVASLTVRTCFTAPYVGNNNMRPLNMYVAIGADSGSGKSTIYNEFFRPIRNATNKLEKAKEKKRARVEMEIADLKEEIKVIRKRNSDANVHKDPAYKAAQDEIFRKKDELDELTQIRWNMAEYNLQKVATTAMEQGGYVAIHSDENEAVDFVVGAKAGIETSIMRKAFDGSGFTYGKEGLDVDFDPYGSICLLGQRNIIEMIWQYSKKAGGESNGLMERFMTCLVEMGVIGRKAGMPRGEAPGEDARVAWKNIIRNLLRMGEDSKVTLEFSDSAKLYMDDLHLKYDSRCLDGDVFSYQPLRGMVQKSHAHMANIAGILHIMKEWCVDLTGEKKPIKVSDETVKQAARIFAELISANLKVFTALGVVGVNVRAREVRDAISRMVQNKRKRVFNNSEIQQASGSRAAFKGKKLTSSELFDSIYPALEADRVLCVVGKKIYINPNFA